MFAIGKKMYEKMKIKVYEKKTKWFSSLLDNVEKKWSKMSRWNVLSHVSPYTKTQPQVGVRESRKR